MRLSMTLSTSNRHTISSLSPGLGGGATLLASAMRALSVVRRRTGGTRARLGKGRCLTARLANTTYLARSNWNNAGKNMNALPDDEMTKVQSYNEIMLWLAQGTRDERYMENIFAALCNRLQTAGSPLKRASLHLQIQHPQWLGARIT